MKLVSVALLGVLTIGSAHAADGIKAGKWEFSAQVQVPNMPKLPPGITLPPNINIGPGGINVTRTSCVDSATPTPADMRPPNQQHGQCKVTKLDNNGGTVKWETTCTQADNGTVVHAEGVAHYAGDTMEATMKTQVTGNNGSANESTQHITGHYLGPCDAK